MEKHINQAFKVKDFQYRKNTNIVRLLLWYTDEDTAYLMLFSNQYLIQMS